MKIGVAIKKASISVVSFFMIFCLFEIPIFSQEVDLERENMIREKIKEHQRKKEKKEKERKKAGRAYVDDVLLELEDAYKKGGEEAAKKYAKEHDIEIKAVNKIGVTLYLELAFTPEFFYSELISYGCDVYGGTGNMIGVDIPIDAITKISEIKGIASIGISGKWHPDSVESEGVSLTGAHSYHSSQLAGTGVKVAVIDGGFAYVDTAILSGDLPSNVVKINCRGTASTCQPDNFFYDDSDHGTAVAEIIHDMAPGALIYLIKIDPGTEVVSSHLSFKKAVDYCISNEIRIINMSGGFYDRNFFRGECFNDNPVCSVIRAYDNGILWVNSIGNAALWHYEATYSDTNHSGWHNVTPAIYVYAGQSIEVTLNWDAWPTTDQDYDLYLFDGGNPPSIWALSTKPQTGIEQPTEKISWTASSTGIYYIYIVRENAVGNHKFEIYVYGLGDNNWMDPVVSSSSLGTPADAAKALSVGAMSQAVWNTGTQEPYSSQGPTNDSRKKPEIIGPDKVQNFTKNPFSGTSAAAPHAAGAAALILSRYPSYSVSQLWGTLISNAIDMGPVGQDNIYGYGKLRLPPLSVLSVLKSGSGSGTITSSPAGINCGTDCKEGYNTGTVVTLTASPAADSVFAGWTGGGCSGTGTCTVTLNADVTVTATFKKYTLTVNKTGSGTGIVTSVPAGINCGSDCTENYTVNAGTVVTLTATPDAGSVFAGWSGGGCGGTGDCSVTMNSDITVTASFNIMPPVANFDASLTQGYYPLSSAFSDLSTGGPPTSWLWDFGDNTTSAEKNPSHVYSSVGSYSVSLTVSNAGGTDSEVKSNYITVVSYITHAITASAGSGGNISPSGSIGVIHGANQKFTITPLTGYHVADVVVDGVSIGAVSTYTFTNITSDHSISASFAQTTYTLSATAGAGGSISPSGTLTVNHGASQTYTIIPDAGYYIADVRVDGKSIGAVATYTFSNITANHTISASFSNATAHTITASAGAGGSISPAGTVTVSYGASQAFTITPDIGYHIVNVLVDDESKGAVSTFPFTNVTTDHTIEASFSNTYTLTVTKSGTESGTVTSNPVGIDCGADCSEAYAPGTVVTLTATPDANATFAGWSGACSGISTTCTITMDADKTVTAIFDKAPVNLWAKTYGGSYTEWGRSIQNTPDGGYILLGDTISFGSGNGDAWVLKLDANGNIQWQKAYGGTDWIEPKLIQVTADGGYVVTGDVRDWDNTSMVWVWVLKLDDSGNIQWQKTYGEYWGNYAYSIQQTLDGGYIVAGSTDHTGANQGDDAWILKLDASGNVQWQKTYGGTSRDCAYSVQQTLDGGYIVAGSTYSGSGYEDLWVIKLDAIGSIQWQKAYGGSDFDGASSILQTSDGGYVIAGYSFSFGSGAAWILKLDVSGNIQWQKTIGGTGNDYATSIQHTLDGGFVVSGYIYSVATGWPDAWLIKLDASGNLQWQKSYGGNKIDYAYSVQQAVDGGYIVAGMTVSFGDSGSYDAWVLKTDNNGNIGDNCTMTTIPNVTIENSSAIVTNTAFTGVSSTISPVTGNLIVQNTNAIVGASCIASNPEGVVTPASLDFGSVDIGSSKTQTITINNTGTTSLVINSIDITGSNANEFYQTSNCTNVSGGGSCTATVTFISVFVGTKSATLSISSNDPNTPVLNVPLSAIGGHLLTVTKSGTGSGTVTSSPAGINCGSDCSGAYNQNTGVTLTATADARSIFAGWLGAGCAGTSTCTASMTSDADITAVFHVLPVADFIGAPTTGIETLTMNFTDLSTGNPTSWLWTFGDESASTEQNPSHTYNSIGTYTVSLTVTNAGGIDTKSKNNYITVQACPNLPVRILGPTPAYYSTLQAAYDAALDGDTIQSRNLGFIENFIANRSISVALEGGYACDYGTIPGYTALKGSIRTSAGTVRIKKFRLQK